MHTYRKSEESLWTVGFEMPDTDVMSWRAIKDFRRERDAAAFTNYLNGGGDLALSYRDLGWS